jgi:hypothetical protein
MVTNICHLTTLWQLTTLISLEVSGVVRVPWEWYFRVELANCSTGADLSIKNKSTTLPNGLPVRGSPPKKRNRIRIATRMLWGRQRGVLSGKGKIK